MGLGVFGAYIPSFLIPVVGEYRTFWFAIPFSVLGLIMCFALVPKTRSDSSAQLTHMQRLEELSMGATIIFRNRDIATCAAIRIINSLLLYGFP